MGISGIGSHDTGRTKNGRDTAESEKRSAEKTIAAVNEAYPGAAGPAWTAQLQANITSASAAQDFPLLSKYYLGAGQAA